MHRNTKLLAAAFALCNAALYCCLLPLWEGFDEPFHYAYIETLSTGRGFPTLRRTPISLEIAESLTHVPVSFILKRALPGTLAFEDWYALPPVEKTRQETALANLSPRSRFSLSRIQNYEAQQAPLAYLLLAPADLLLARVSLRPRILILRLCLTFLSTLLVFFACQVLCRELGLKAGFALLLLFCTFATQIFWAAVAHVANDWLSVALSLWFLAILLRFIRTCSRYDCFLLSVLLALGLLSKAYFISFVPVFLAALFLTHLRSLISVRTAAVSLAILVALTGPWYARNLVLYRSFTGMQESVAGARSGQVANAVFQINWLKSIVESARWSVWSGNESHPALSQTTLNIELILLLAALALLGWRYKAIRRAEWWLLAGVAAFVAALLYDLCLTWVDTHGAQTTTGPYYSPCILPAIFALAFLGLQRSRFMGRMLAIAICLITFWVAFLSYLVKLIPFYGGLIGRANLSAVYAWWTHDPQASLSGLTLAPFPVVVALLALFLVLLIALTARTVTLLARRPVSYS